jgi:hypothetical protein
MKKRFPNLNFTSSFINLDGVKLECVSLTYEGKNHVFDMILAKDQDNFHQLFKKDSKLVTKLNESDTKKLHAYFYPLKPDFENYLKCSGTYVSELGERFSKNELWWKLKEMVDFMNKELQSNKNTVKKSNAKVKVKSKLKF